MNLFLLGTFLNLILDIRDGYIFLGFRVLQSRVSGFLRGLPNRFSIILEFFGYFGYLKKLNFLSH